MEDSGESQSESENSVSDSVDDNDDSVAEISRSFRSRQELCEQLNVNHMIQRIFLITLDNSKLTVICTDPGYQLSMDNMDQNIYSCYFLVLFLVSKLKKG